jgi:hypothetical protein
MLGREVKETVFTEFGHVHKTIPILTLSEYQSELTKKAQIMKKNTTISHLDATMKASAIGLLTYVGVQQGWSAEIVAALIPVATFALSFVSTKIGDKNTTLLLKLITQAAAAAPVKKAAKKAPAKKVQ